MLSKWPLLSLISWTLCISVVYFHIGLFFLMPKTFYISNINCHLCYKILSPSLFALFLLWLVFIVQKSWAHLYFPVSHVVGFQWSLPLELCLSICLTVPVLCCCKQCFCEHTFEPYVCAHGQMGLWVRFQKWNCQDRGWHCIYVLTVDGHNWGVYSDCNCNIISIYWI